MPLASRWAILIAIFALLFAGGAAWFVVGGGSCPNGETIYAVAGAVKGPPGVHVADIFVLRDGEATRVTRGGESWNPTLSPDGERIVFERSEVTAESDQFGQEDVGLFIVNADGSDLKRFSDVKDDDDPEWSPDGSRVAFARGGSLVTIDVETGATKEIIASSKPGAQYVYSPTWSSDSERIAFFLRLSPNPGLYVADSDGLGDAERLLAAPGGFELTWSPDGKTFAWERNIGTTDTIFTWIIGQESPKKIAVFGSNPHFLDNDTIVHWAGREGEGPEAFAPHLVTRPVDGGTATHVVGTYEHNGEFDVITCP